MQTSYSLDPAIAKEGMIADSRRLKHIVSRLAEGVILAGKAVFRSPVYGAPFTGNSGDPGQVYQAPSPAAAVDVDAIVTTHATAATEQVLSGSDLNGAVGGDSMRPGRLITATLSSHADFNAGTMTVVGELGGIAKSEEVTIPDAGNATISTTGAFDVVTSITISAQGGTGGSYTIGIAVLDSSVTEADFEGFALYNNSIPANVVPCQDQDSEWHDRNTVDVMQVGALWAVAEVPASALYKGAVYVRISGGQMGAVRHDVDSSTAIAVTGWRFASNADLTTGLVKIEKIS